MRIKIAQKEIEFSAKIFEFFKQLTLANKNLFLHFCSFETSDGTSRQESAVVNNLGSDAEEIAVKGSITWTSPEGEVFTLNYIADKNGYQPQGKTELYFYGLRGNIG